MEQRYVALESWRGIAACLVALFHLDAYSHFHALPFLRNCWLFVDFFFVLSGFIIAANYQTRLQQGFGIRRFLLLRLGRLYPLHFTMLALFVAFELLKAVGRSMMTGAVSPGSAAPFSTAADAPATIFANLLLIQSFHVFDFLSWNVPSWSISTEFYTYVLFALCLVTLRKNARILLPAALIAGPVLIVLLSDQNMSTTYDWGIIRCVYGFAAGVTAWHVYKNAQRFRRWLAAGSVASLVEGVALGAAIVFVTVADKATPLSIAAPYLFAAIVLVFACEAGAASAFLMRRPLIFLGTVSYSIYMTHVFVEQRMFDAASAFGKILHANVFTHVEVAGHDVFFLGTRAWQGDLAYIVYLLLVIGMSWVTYSWIERPAREWMRSRVQRRKALPVAQQSWASDF